MARYEESIKKLNNRQGFIDLFWPAKLIVEQKSAGRDLGKAAIQAGEYFDALKESEKPRYQLVCDFQTFELLDRDTRETSIFALKDLPQHVEKFGFIMGVEKRTFRDQDPVNIEAAELVGKVPDALKDSNYTGHQLEVFLTRLVFCLFADDTGIFEPRDIFLDYLETRTKPDGSDTGSSIAELFQTLNTPENQRQANLDEDLAAFPYVNGALFSDPLHIPAFNSDMRNHLIEASRFNWSNISPAIFGSLFQSVMNAKERRALGAHYTTEKNILKVIEPLFLDDLRAEFKTIKARKNKRKDYLRGFQEKLGNLTFFDPACGCGNFLIITYRELRLLEIEVLRELYGTQKALDLSVISKIDVDQFYGIEVDEFPARIAETALWMMDHIMNSQASIEFGYPVIRIPLKKSPHILHGDALAIDWADHLPAEKCSYIMGNPPFIGKTYQTASQKMAMSRVFSDVKNGKLLDFVAAWFLLAAKYIQGQKIECAFVSTNSISQGEQVAVLWGELLGKYKCEINFAYQTFPWSSEARGKAAVHCVIIGFGTVNKAGKRIFEVSPEDDKAIATIVKQISPYLVEGPKLIIRKSNKPLFDAKLMRYGSKPADGGNLILTDDEKDNLIKAEPIAAKWLRRYIGSADLINGGGRWCLWLNDASPNELNKTILVKDRITAVRTFRGKSSDANTLKWA